MGKLTVQDLAKSLAGKSGLVQRDASQFASEVFAVILQGLEKDGQVKVKGLGTFKIISVEARESISVRTGERVVIESHEKVSFTPDSVMKELVNKPNFFHDKDSDGYYDCISAFQKSIRGSDVDAAIHYLARLIEAGDLDIIYRRMNVIAYEDIGLANPMMGVKVDAAIHSCERLGLPEARIILANVVIELALSPKSNSAYLAIADALNDINKGSVDDVPKHLQTNSPNYLYAHDYENHVVAQQYLPNNLKHKRYYKPQNNKNEETLKKINDKLKKIING